MPNSEKRSRTDGMTASTPRTPGSAGGVGGRHRNPPPPPEGGGYLDVYTKNGEPLLIDPRLGELAEAGLSTLWLRVASVVGVDQFLVIWRLLDEVNAGAEVRDAVRLRVPLFSNYEKMQRNKLILAYQQAGQPPEEIQKKLKVDLCEDISLRHIKRVIKKYKI